MLAHTLVNVAIIGLASLIILALVVLVTGAEILFSPLLVPFIVLGVALFCGFGALLGRIADSQDGVIAASNGVALPLLFLSETFVPLSLLPEWFHPFVNLSPLTWFSRGVRAATYWPLHGEVMADATVSLAALTLLTVLFFVAGTLAIPRTD